MWECQWKALKQLNVALNTLVEGFHLQPPLEPRDAFFGGKTNAIRR